MRIPLLTGAMLAVLTPYARTQALAPDLSGSTMEELTQMEVSISSVSRKNESLFHTAAAAYVITREDIIHSTANSIPELLRSVPGLQVAQISASTWAVSARGFNSAYANKLLVLIDGRTVYSEIYSGAHWDEIDLPLDDVERIEVIRGPGAVIWGTNAVNGVINIITRPARAVQSPALSGEVSRVQDSATFVQGTSFGNDGQYRGSLSLINRNPLDNADGSTAHDGELLYRANGRLDLRRSNGATVSVLGGIYGGTLRQEVLSSSASMMDLSNGQENDFLVGSFGLVRFNRETTRNAYEVQAYASSAVRHELSATDRTVTESAELVDHFHVNSRVDLVSGAELRLTQDAAQAPIPVLLEPSYKNYLVDSFLQGDFVLLPDRLTATLGSKVQDGTLAGFQVQPSVRLAWTIDTSQFAWGAVSRSVVAPSVQDRALNIDILLGTSMDGMTVEGNLMGNPAFKPETVIAYEAGYRRHLLPKLTVDLAAFYNVNQRMQSITVGTPSLMMDPMQHIMVPLEYGNGFAGASQGVEGSLDWKPGDHLSLKANYTWLQAQINEKQPGEVSLIDSFSSPRNSIAGLWNWNFHRDWNFGGQVEHVGILAAGSGSDSMLSHSSDQNNVPAYTRLDAGLERHLGERLAFAVGGTNLLSPRHVEFSGFSAFLTPLYVPRSLFLRAHWSF